MANSVSPRQKFRALMKASEPEQEKNDMADSMSPLQTFRALMKTSEPEQEAELPAQVEPPKPEPTREERLLCVSAGIDDARLAVSRFLNQQPDVKHATITRLAAAGTGCWEAEAEVYVPNAMIKTLGLELSRQVLDRRLYVLRLDSECKVVAYEFKEAAEASETSM